ncbi:MAG TPA: hypothetical protein VG056_07535 [Pirellulales bacterium]|jgi:flagellar M-ring protein FliF|nr:hypothetical protein [Pirellulales bacterium]
MDFLNKAIAQITDLFRSMTPGARITAGLLLAVLVVSLGYLVNHQASSADDFLFGGDPIPSSQLIAIRGAFGKAKLSDFDIDANGAIRVPRAQKALYLAALADANALPRGFGDYMISAIKDVGPFGSQKQQKEMFQVAQERELAAVIAKMNGIESAEVMYNIEPESGLSTQRSVKTASVSVKPQGNDPLNDERAQSIRQFVAAAIGCKPTDISVLDLNTNSTFPGGGNGVTGGGLDDAYATAKRRYERDYQTTIRDALSFIPGAKVNVNVELNTELEVETREDRVDPKTIPVEVEENTHTSSTQPGSVGGSPGLARQGGVLSNTGAVLGASSGPKTEEDTQKTRTKNTATQTQSVTRKAGLTPSRVTVTVGVPSSYYEKVWRMENPTPAGAEPKAPSNSDIDKIESAEKLKIQGHVAQLLPKPDAKVQETTPLVTVTTFQQLPSTPITPPSTADKALFWLSQYWSTLGMIGLGLVSLLILRSVVKAMPAAELPRREAVPIATVPAGETEAPPEVEQQEAAARLKRRAKSGPTLRDELVEIVREDPDAAANILRNWIGSAT